MTHCPCNPRKDYGSCCEPYIRREQNPEGPETLMRSRYTAYTLANIDYIKETMYGKALIGFQELDATRWAKRVHWIKLDVIASHMENPTTGYVEFEAYFVDCSCLKSIHEKSKFVREGGRWYYVDGICLPASHTEKHIARTTSCPCGSQRKFKNCHGRG